MTIRESKALPAFKRPVLPERLCNLGRLLDTLARRSSSSTASGWSTSMWS